LVNHELIGRGLQGLVKHFSLRLIVCPGLTHEGAGDRALKGGFASVLHWTGAINSRCRIGASRRSAPAVSCCRPWPPHSPSQRLQVSGGAVR
jgi:hypothetical protein